MHVHDFSMTAETCGLWSLPMKPSSLIALLVAGAALASPAVAETSVAKGKKVCESAALAQTPAPKSARIDDDKTKSSDATLTYTLKVKNADGSAVLVVCKVDRATDTPTL